MDFHKRLPTPKLTSQDWYYSKKLRTNLFGIYCANEGTINCFLYDETIGGVGPNEVISLLDYLLIQLENRLGKFDHLIVWSDNAASTFKECYLFFFFDYLVKRGQFLRADLKFLLEGHTYSVCDRHFGTIQRVFDSIEVIQVPQQWATVLRTESQLLNVRVYWVTLDVIKDYKTFLRLQYTPRNVDLEGNKFEVKRIAWLNFGYGEIVHEDENLKLEHHPNCVYIRFRMDQRRTPTRVCFQKRKQAIELRPELLETLRLEKRPVPEGVKNFCIKLAQKYLNENAIRFYQSLQSVDEEGNLISDSDE